MSEQQKQDDEPIYTVIRNKSKTSKCVFSMLNGIEIAPLQTLDLRGMFRRAQLQDAASEIHALIRAGYIEDISGGDPKVREEANKSATEQIGNDVQRKIRESLVRDISASTSMSQLEDYLGHRDPEVAKAAQVRLDILTGLRDDSGAVIPGNEEETSAAPTTVGGSLVG